MHNWQLCASSSILDLLPHFPPSAIVEVLQDYVANYQKVTSSYCGGFPDVLRAGVFTH